MTSFPIGVSFHTRHFQDILSTRPGLSFFEVHCENYMTPGGLSRQMLREIRALYEVSAHGVGLSLGSAEGLNQDHLRRLKAFYQEFSPFLVSEHLSWSRHGETYLNDLLPIPYTKAALHVFERNITQAQDVLGRRLLIENPSTYLSFQGNTYTETDFMKELCHRTGCGLLLDVNNIFVSCFNGGEDPFGYLEDVPEGLVAQYHLAGHKRHPDVYIDDHGSQVSQEVWRLYEKALERLGSQPTLIEWDTDVPTLGVLVDQAKHARQSMARMAGETANGTQLSA